MLDDRIIDETAKKVMARITGKPLIVCPDCDKICETVIVERHQLREFSINHEIRSLIPKPLDWHDSDFSFRCPHCYRLNLDEAMRDYYFEERG